MDITCDIIEGDCLDYLKSTDKKFDLTFLDPPFNVGNKYDCYIDKVESDKYWNWMLEICKMIYEKTSDGGAIYFMHREKNIPNLFDVLSKANWTYQNLIIWKKKTSPAPTSVRFGKQYQVIAFFTKGERPRVFNRLRIESPPIQSPKLEHPDGIIITDVWDDIRELTSGFLANGEALKLPDGTRAHNYQSPLRLLTRIILVSTKPYDFVFDPFAGTGTTLVVAKQLNRHSVGIDISHNYVELVKKRIEKIRKYDDLTPIREYYRFTENLDEIWTLKHKQITLDNA